MFQPILNISNQLEIMWLRRGYLKVCQMKVLNLLLHSPKFPVKLNGSYLKVARVSFTPNKIRNLYIVFEIKSWPSYFDNGFTLRNSLFGAIKVSENPDPNKYPYSVYGILVNVCETFWCPKVSLVRV